MTETQAQTEEKDRNPQVTFVLSEKAHSEMSELAEWKGMKLATYIRTIIESHYDSPSFGSLQKRMREDKSRKAKENAEITDQTE